MEQRAGRWVGWSAALLGGILVLAGGCSQERPKANAGNATAGPRKISVTVARIEGRDMERTVQIVGTLQPEEEVTLGTEVSSTVVKILVDFGDRVQVGQPVIRLDDRGARLEVERATASTQTARESLGRAVQVLESSRANLERARAVLTDAQLNLKRYEALFGEGAISASQRDSARTQHDVAVAGLRAAEAQLESDRAGVKAAEASLAQSQAALEIFRKLQRDTNIVSPINGFVRKRLVNVGDTFKEKTPLMSLVATDTLRLQGDVPERFASQVTVGRSVRMEVEAYPGRVFPCTITRINPTVDAENRSFLVEASVPNPQGILKPGFFAKASIVVGTERNVPFAPEAAVMSFAGNVKVYVITEGTAEERRVRTGVRREGLVEILDGVKVGETVATSNLVQLATGTAVTVQAGTQGAGDPPRSKGPRPEGRKPS